MMIALEYVGQWWKKNKKIKLLNNIKNLGPALSRKQGLKISSGDYICFLDSDDYWNKNKLYKQLQFMEKNLYSMSFTECYHFKNNLLNRNFKIPSEINYEKLLKHNYIITSSTMIKSEIIKLNDITNVGYDDYNLWLNLCKKGYNFFYLSQKLSVYRHVEKSVSSNKFRALNWVFKIYHNSQKKNIILSTFYTILNGVTAIYKKTKYTNV